MIKTVTYEAVDKSALRKKGWKLFGFVIGLQVLIVFSSYLIGYLLY